MLLLMKVLHSSYDSGQEAGGRLPQYYLRSEFAERSLPYFDNKTCLKSCPGFFLLILLLHKIADPT